MTASGLALARNYDLNQWLTGISLTATTGALLDVSFTRDTNGNVSAVNDTAAVLRNASYAYSDANRLASASGFWGSDSYTYDANGNRTQASRTTVQGGGSDVATIGATSNRLTEVRDAQGALARSFGYDGAGEMVSQDWADGRSFTYDYDARGRLAGVSVNGTQLVANLYDYQERRVSRTQTSGGVSGTVHSIYDDGGQLLAEHDGSTGAMLREYVWLEGSLLAIVEGPVSAPVYSYVHTGHLDEPVMVTDASGQVTSSITRDPWGNAILLAGSAELSLGYPGQWHDQEAGLYQNWHRDYDPTLGRYIQSDPIGLAGGTNLYAYVDGNPVNAVDPTGLQRKGGGPYHPPSNVRLKCTNADSCPQLLAKMNQLMRMIQSHEGWDRRNPKPRGGNRHAKEIADLWNAYARCQELARRKQCENCPEKAYKAAGAVVGAAALTYIAYRIARMAPSIAIPALWPTIPVNAITP